MSCHQPVPPPPSLPSAPNFRGGLTPAPSCLAFSFYLPIALRLAKAVYTVIGRTYPLLGRTCSAVGRTFSLPGSTFSPLGSEVSCHGRTYPPSEVCFLSSEGRRCLSEVCF